MGIIITVLAWAWQIGVTIGIGFMAAFVFCRKKRKTVYRLARLGFVAAMFVLLVCLTVHPIVISAGTADDGNQALPKEIGEEIRDFTKGLYSPTIPLVPAVVTVTGTEGEVFCVRTYYLYGGTVEYEYIPGSGPSITKPLSML